MLSTQSLAVLPAEIWKLLQILNFLWVHLLKFCRRVCIFIRSLCPKWFVDERWGVVMLFRFLWWTTRCQPPPPEASCAFSSNRKKGSIHPSPQTGNNWPLVRYFYTSNHGNRVALAYLLLWLWRGEEHFVVLRVRGLSHVHNKMFCGRRAIICPTLLQQNKQCRRGANASQAEGSAAWLAEWLERPPLQDPVMDISRIAAVMKVDQIRLD